VSDMFIVEKGETLLLRAIRSMSDEEMRYMADALKPLQEATGINMVLLDYSVEPVAVQKA